MSGRFDVQNQLCDEQDFTGSATVSENSYQKQNAAQDISIGRRYALMVLPTTAAGAGSTHTLEVIQADVTALTTNVASVASISVAAADLTLGDVIEIPIPEGSLDQLHIGFRHTATGGTTTLSCDVYLVPQDEIANFKSFPKTNIAIV